MVGHRKTEVDRGNIIPLMSYYVPGKQAYIRYDVTMLIKSIGDVAAMDPDNPATSFMRGVIRDVFTTMKNVIANQYIAEVVHRRAATAEKLGRVTKAIADGKEHHSAAAEFEAELKIIDQIAEELTR